MTESTLLSPSRELRSARLSARADVARAEGAALGHGQGAGVGPVLELAALVEEGADVDHQGRHGHQGDGEEDDQDEDGALLVGRDRASRAVSRRIA